jgi:MazG family protein
MNKEVYSYEDLLEIMKILRSPQGCPWDREQDHESLKKYIIEETYEVIEAIDLKNPEKLCEELGDVLLQVVFHSRIAEENGQFSMNDVIQTVSEKMVHRHKHVFGLEQAETADDVIDLWEKIKKEEKGYKNHTSVLDGVPSVLPALMRSYKIQQKAAKVGFDWDEPFTLEAPQNLTAELKYDQDNIPYFEIKLDIPQSVKDIDAKLIEDSEYFKGKSCEPIEIQVDYKYADYDWNEGPSLYWSTSISVEDFLWNGVYEYRPFEEIDDAGAVNIKEEVYSFRAYFYSLCEYMERLFRAINIPKDAGEENHTIRTKNVYQPIFIGIRSDNGGLSNVINSGDSCISLPPEILC